MIDASAILKATGLCDAAMAEMVQPDEQSSELDPKNEFWIACVWFSVAVGYAAELEDNYEILEALDQVDAHLTKYDPAMYSLNAQVLKAGVDNMRLIFG